MKQLKSTQQSCPISGEWSHTRDGARNHKNFADTQPHSRSINQKFSSQPGISARLIPIELIMCMITMEKTKKLPKCRIICTCLSAGIEKLISKYRNRKKEIEIKHRIRANLRLIRNIFTVSRANTFHRLRSITTRSHQGDYINFTDNFSVSNYHRHKVTTRHIVNYLQSTRDIT